MQTHTTLGNRFAEPPSFRGAKYRSGNSRAVQDLPEGMSEAYHVSSVKLPVEAWQYASLCQGSTYANGGGGGNRTPVPRRVSGCVYVCSPFFEFAEMGSSGQDPTSAIPNSLSRSLSVGKRSAASLLLFAHYGPRRQGPRDVAAYAARANWVLAVVFCEVFSEASSQPRHAASTSNRPVDSVRPHRRTGPGV